jgi:hypothetical protein
MCQSSKLQWTKLKMFTTKSITTIVIAKTLTNPLGVVGSLRTGKGLIMQLASELSPQLLESLTCQTHIKQFKVS